MSDEVATTLIPIRLTLDGPVVDIYDVTRDRGALVEMEAAVGDLITIHLGDAYSRAGGYVRGRLYGPDGTEVPEQQYVHGPINQTFVSRYYRATTTGTHTLVLSSDESSWPGGSDVRVTASTPLVVPVALDQQKTVFSHRQRQVIDLEFTGKSGQGIGIWPSDVGYGCPTAQLYLGDELVPRRFAALELQPPDMESAWELPMDGTFHMRLWPCDNTPLQYTVTIVSAEEVQLEFRQDTRIDLSRRGAYGVAAFTTTAGKHVQLDMVDWSYPGWQQVVVAPDGSLIQPYYDFVAPQTGTYKLWLSPGQESWSYAVWRATESNN